MQAYRQFITSNPNVLFGKPAITTLTDAAFDIRRPLR